SWFSKWVIFTQNESALKCSQSRSSNDHGARWTSSTPKATSFRSARAASKSRSHPQRPEISHPQHSQIPVLLHKVILQPANFRSGKNPRPVKAVLPHSSVAPPGRRRRV